MKYGIGAPRKLSPRRAGIFFYIHVLHHHVSRGIHVVAVEIRRVVEVSLEDLVVAGGVVASRPLEIAETPTSLSSL